MEIFEAEKKAGLESLLSPAMGSVKYDSALSTKNINSLSLAHLIDNKTVSNHKDSDLFPIDSLMVSVGWNKNDDVFLKERIWAARSTPEDKPLNINHNELEIVGHIIGNYVVDNEAKVIANDTDFADLPDVFHIIASSVMYQAWSDEERLKQVTAIIDQIKLDLEETDKSKAQWFVSMECLFGGFDYAVIDETGEQYLIDRNKESAFLTAHLRAYGGDGKFGKYQIGRAMKNLRFSALGLVNKPANPASVIFDGVLSFREESTSQLQDIMENAMANVTDNDTGKELINEYKTKIEALENDKKVALAKVAELEAKAKEVSDKLVKTEADSKVAVDALNTKVVALETEKADLSTKLADATVKIEANDKALAEIKANEVKAKRISALVEKGLDKTEAEAKVEQFKALDDATFEAVAALVKKSEAAPEAKPTEPAASHAAASLIVDAKVVAGTAPLAVGTVVIDEDKQKAKAAMVEMFSEVLGNKKQKKN